MGLPGILLASLALSLGATFLLWLLSLRLRDASIIDIWWGPGFAAIALFSWWLAPAGHPLAALLTLVWGLRLGVYLLWRNHGGGEDPRYQAMRRHHGDRFPVRSLFSVFWLQGALMWFISLPVQVAQAGGMTGIGAFEIAGGLLWTLGIAFEAVGDAQLARFKADPAHAGRVMDRGLWRYTRHPNYFGDACVWWGLGVMALGVPGGVWTLASPAVMNFFLLRVSGVALLERSITRRRPEYAEYQRRTSAFLPWPPRAD